jgi:hypothetical protein
VSHRIATSSLAAPKANDDVKSQFGGTGVNCNSRAMEQALSPRNRHLTRARSNCGGGLSDQFGESPNPNRVRVRALSLFRIATVFSQIQTHLELQKRRVSIIDNEDTKGARQEPKVGICGKRSGACCFFSESFEHLKEQSIKGRRGRFCFAAPGSRFSGLQSGSSRVCWNGKGTTSTDWQ